MQVTVGDVRHRRRLREVLRRRDRHLRRLAPDQGRRGGARSARRTASSTARSRSPTTASPSSTNKDLAVDCLTTDQLKQVWNKGSKVKSLSEVDPKLPDTEALALRPGHRLRHVRLLHRRDQRRGGRDAARTTRPPRTTTSSSRASRATTAASATSASPTTRAPRTSSTWSASTPATAASSRRTETIQDGSYKPLSRPLFMYPSAKAMGRPEVKAFMEFVVARPPAIAEAAKIVPLTDEQVDDGQGRARQGRERRAEQSIGG